MAVGCTAVDIHGDPVPCPCGLCNCCCRKDWPETLYLGGTWADGSFPLGSCAHITWPAYPIPTSLDPASTAKSKVYQSGSLSIAIFGVPCTASISATITCTGLTSFPVGCGSFKLALSITLTCPARSCSGTDFNQLIKLGSSCVCDPMSLVFCGTTVGEPTGFYSCLCQVNPDGSCQVTITLAE